MRVLAVAVTYNPDPDLLARVLGSVAPQVQGIAVVDNNSSNARSVRDAASAVRAHVLENEQNLGIAAAQNQGVALARDEGYSHILLLDQDTVLAAGVVADLSSHLAALEVEYDGVAAIGPAYYELNSERQTRAYQANGPLLSRRSLKGLDCPVESDFIIASASLVSLDTLDKIGSFKEDLFIDLVDVEWCLRARASGYQSFLSPTAAVEHRLGSTIARIGPRRVAVHVPIRNYYWVRNALWLSRQPYTPLAWRLYFISRALIFPLVYTTLTDHRLMRLRLICRGIWDSFTGHLGSLK
ncbi:glycosyltransferase family 2 protein [Microvirga aerilata]|uniref:Glycosyltransferase family 2 protein n=1 Tax=Microvirga aerilata TaxID=670292 RepID=A0A936ZC47_9HYPH|nr:glycosyltransferase family 2 protein [Microvirga aerilata]MBL0405055.1 glycosyltransferase family 2 protein [Microvirga aerilata]